MGAIAIEQTPLWADIRSIMHATAKPTRYEYRAMLHTEKEDLVILKIDSLDQVRDYVNNIGEVTQIEFKMPLGEYMIRLYPYRTNLELTIKRILLTDDSNSRVQNSSIQTTRYKAVFLVDSNPVLTGTEYEQHDTETLNNLDIVSVKLQLLNRSLEVIRIRQTQGIFKQVTQKKLIHNLLAGESLKVQVDGKPSIDSINIVEPDNSDVRQHVIIPSSTIVTTIPSYLQEKMGGVYNSGIGNFLQRYKNRMTWFVYPTWNTKRFVKTKDDKVIFYALPEDKFPALDRTYLADSGVLKVLVTGQKKYSDSADIDYMNRGSGFRMTDARAFMNKAAELTEDGPMARRGNLNTEVAAEARKDGLNFAPRTASASSNPFKEYSKINSRNIARIDVVWENGDPELIYPGMPCKYVFLDEGRSVELTGTVGFVHAVSQRPATGMSSNMFMTNCAVTLLCEQKPKTRALPKAQPQGGVF